MLGVMPLTLMNITLNIPCRRTLSLYVPTSFNIEALGKE